MIIIIATNIYKVLLYPGLRSEHLMFFVLDVGIVSSQLEHSRGRLDFLCLSLGIQMWILALRSRAGVQVCTPGKMGFFANHYFVSYL